MGVLATSPAVRWIKAQPRGWKGRFSGRGRNSIGYAADMADVTQILSAIEQGDPQAAEQLLPLVYDELRKLAAAAAGPGEAGPDAPGHRPGPRGLPAAGRTRAGPALEQPRPLLRRRGRGHAPHPRRERPPQAGRQARRRTGSESTSTTLDAGRSDRPTTCSPWTRPSTGWPREDPAGGPAGQAPLLRRADRSRRPPTALGISRATADRHWAYARAWLHDAARPASDAER